jgi:galactose mutarotase-like enzyme
MTSVSPILARQVINDTDWNNGPVKRKGIDLLPVKVGDVEAVFSNLGGNLLSLELSGNPGRVQVAKSFLDFTGDNNFVLPELKGMMQIGGLTPPMYPGVGRLTELPGEIPVGFLKDIPGYRMLADDIGIHGAAHNRLWKMTDQKLDKEDTHRIEVEFNINPDKNQDIFEIFKSGYVHRSYYLKPIDNGVNVTIITALQGNGVFGDHTFIETKNRERWTLEAPAETLWEADPSNNNIPTGEIIEGRQFNSPVALSGAFDGAFTNLRVEKHYDAVSTLLNTEDGTTISLLQTVNMFPHRNIFTPIESDGSPKDFTCVEAFTVPPDAYRLSRGKHGKLVAPNGIKLPSGLVGRQVFEVKFAK